MLRPPCDGGQRTAAAQVTGDEAQRGEIFAEELRGAMGAVAEADAVKTIAAHMLVFEPVIGYRVDDGGQRHGAVEGGIEDSDLGHAGQQLLNRLDTFQVGRVMLRREGGHTLDIVLDRLGDEHAVLKLVAAMHDAMPHDVDCAAVLNHASLTAPDGFEHVRNHLATFISLQGQLTRPAMRGRDLERGRA